MCLRPQWNLHLLCEVSRSANDQVALAQFCLQMWSECCCAQSDQRYQYISVLLQTLGLLTDIFWAVHAEAVRQRGTASILRLTSCSLAYTCGAALMTGKTARQAQISLSFHSILCDAALHTLKLQSELLYPQTAGTTYLETPTLNCLSRTKFEHCLWQVGVL